MQPSSGHGHGHATPPQHAPGRRFLLVCGILYAVFGGFALIGAVTLQEVGQALGTFDDFWGIGTAVVAETSRWAFLLFISAGIMIVAGVLGIAWKDKLQKANILIIVAIIAMAFDIISNIITNSLNAMIIISLALPILYLIGAVLNKNALTAQSGRPPSA